MDEEQNIINHLDQLSNEECSGGGPVILPCIKKFHRCYRCGRRFQRSENLQKHLSKQKPCRNILNINNSSPIASPFYEGGDNSGEILITDNISIQWDPIPDSLPIYSGLSCPFCNKSFNTISNRNRHIRHYCDEAKVVYFKKAVDEEIIRRLENALNQIKSKNMTNDEIIKCMCKFMIGENIIINHQV